MFFQKFVISPSWYCLDILLDVIIANQKPHHFISEKVRLIIDV